MNDPDIDKANSKMISLCEEIASNSKYDYRAIDEFIPFLKGNNLSHLANYQRLKLLFNLNKDFLIQQKQWEKSLDRMALNISPVSELYPLTATRSPRGVKDRWIAAGGKVIRRKMMALKTDPVWARFSRFGSPWPPFDYDNVMYIRDIMSWEMQGLSLTIDFTPMTPNSFEISMLSVDDPGLDEFIRKTSS